MTSYNVTMTVGQPSQRQILVDEQALAELQKELARRSGELDRLKSAMETLAAVNAPARFMAAALALVNELASSWKAERVGIGFLRGRYVRLMALSHTEKITRHMQVVQDTESAMEECLDQDLEILFPPVKDAAYVYRATEQLSQKHGPTAVVSFPLRRDGKVIGVLTLERKSETALSASDVETIRLTCDLFTARLADLYENDQWIGAKAARNARKALAWAIGAKHTWAKAAAILIFAILCFALFVKGTYNVEGQFSIESVDRQILSAPFDGVLKNVYVQVGDPVFAPATAQRFDAIAASPIVPLLPTRPASVLATFETPELLMRLSGAKADRTNYLQQANQARKEGITKQSEVDIALSQAARAQAQIDLFQWQIDQATIRSPIDGIVFAGDLRPRVGAHLKVGDELFEVGARELLRAEISVPEDQVSDLRIGMAGELAAASYPGEKLKFTVERINPLATVAGAHNVFKVRVRFDAAEIRPWMKPGMEGTAKVHAGHETYAWLWTHKLINWVRMKLWI